MNQNAGYGMMMARYGHRTLQNVRANTTTIAIVTVVVSGLPVVLTFGVLPEKAQIPIKSKSIEFQTDRRRFHNRESGKMSSNPTYNPPQHGEQDQQPAAAWPPGYGTPYPPQQNYPPTTAAPYPPPQVGYYPPGPAYPQSQPSQAPPSYDESTKPVDYSGGPMENYATEVYDGEVFAFNDKSIRMDCDSFLPCGYHFQVGKIVLGGVLALLFVACFAIQCCAVLYSALLYSAVLYSALLCCAALYSAENAEK
ncbi:hypothetical protein QZH41_003835 [Actinostola sp. cb2023]|nr:hypothetical protein QZH41_003835 [Actinostola sp. cb2023]